MTEASCANAILGELEQALAAIEPEQVPALVVRLAALLSALGAKVIDSTNWKSPTPKADQLAKLKLYTAEEVAKHLSVPESLVYSKARSGELPSTRFGKYVRFTDAAINGFVLSHSSLDTTLYERCSYKDDGRRVPKSPKNAQINAGRTGREDGHDGQHRRPVGKRRTSNLRTRVPFRPALDKPGDK